MRYYYYILTVLFFSSCEKIIEVDIEETEPLMVVNCLFNPDSVWELELSQSKYVFDTASIQKVEDALVAVRSTSGDEVILNHVERGLYRATGITPIIGETYSLLVEHNGLENIKSINMLPIPSQITNLTINRTLQITGEEAIEVVVFFEDSDNEDYYMIETTGGFQYDILDTLNNFILSFEEEGPLPSSTNSVLIESKGGKQGGDYVIFSDEFINGKEASIDLLIDPYYSIEDTVLLELEPGSKEKIKMVTKLAKVYIELSSVSEDYYLYQSSYNKYQEIQGNPFAQPVQVYTNIENGFGIFGGISSTVDSIEVN